MSMVDLITLLIVAAWIAGLARLAFVGLALKGSRQVGDLRRILAAGEAAGGSASVPLPPLSVIVTARDEVDGIEETVGRLLAQDYPGLEVVVIDDRSTDGTGEILDRLAAEHAAAGHGRLTVIHNRELPAGWLGKCHACRLGAERARGEWLLFTDGDVALMDRRLLARVVAHAGRQRLDHIAVFPDLRPMSPLQAGLVTTFGTLFLLGARAYEMDRDRARGGGGVGAFNLVRRSAYDRFGGHRLLSMDLGDDFKLGRLLKESGARQRIYDGVDLIRCPWHRGAINVVRGLEKNLFSGFNFSMLEIIGLTALLLILGFGAGLCALAVTLLLACGHGAGAFAGAPGPALLAAVWIPAVGPSIAALVSYVRESHRFGYNPYVLWAMQPISTLLMLYAAWNSALVTLLQGGVRWRGTFHPLHELRRGIVPPGAGRRFHPEA